MEKNKNTGKSKKRGAADKVMDRETAIAIIKSCGYSVPENEAEWKEYTIKLANFLEKLDVNQRNSIVRPARKVANDRVRVANAGITIEEEDLNKIIEYIPLGDSKLEELDVFEVYSDMTEEAKKIVIESIQMGLAGQQKAIQQLEKLGK